MENQIKAWLKANIMVDYLNRPDEVIQAMEGMPTGGVIAPLLGNIALHGLGDHIKNWYANTWYPTTGRNFNVGKRDRMAAVGFTRYADDFVFITPERVDIIELEKQVAIWLHNEVGLELSKAKTKIVNSTEGFDFLGFQIIAIQRSSGAYKVKIHPSIRSRAHIIQRTRNIIQKNRSASSFSLINLLNSRIIGWANYFQYFECSQDFSKLDYLIFNQVRAWVFRRKSKGLRSRTALKLKYFPEGNTYHFRGKDSKNNWILVGKSLTKYGKLQENFLTKMTWVGSAQYVKIKGKASPYDGNHLYWAKRTEKYSGLNHSVSKLIRIQNGCCGRCGISFTPEDHIEVDHIIPRSKDGSDRYKTLQALHKHCHI
jgi:RNA-directed DNA polymerase